MDAGDMMLELTLQGASQEAVVLHGLHVRVLSQEAALDRPAYSMGKAVGRHHAAVLRYRPGRQPAALEARRRVGRRQGRSGEGLPYRVSSSDVQVFNIDAHVEDHDVTWYLELEWSSGDRSGTVRIDDNGKPFHTSAITDRPQYIYRFDTAEWVERDTTLEDGE
ncbi:hypothetical protein NKH18_22600 [Streptomyces sp. M10(2022)]